MFKNAFRFIWQIIKPYKWWYLLILQAPLMNAIYVVFFNYSIKLLIDLLSQNVYLTAKLAAKPMFYFIGGVLMLEISWRIHNFSSWMIMPKIYQRLFLHIFKYTMGHSYVFFQNTQGGTILSKVRSIDHGYVSINRSLEYSLSRSILCCIFTAAMLCFVSFKLFLIVCIFVTIFVPIAWAAFNHLACLELKREESFHKIVGIFSDCVTNIFTIFAFASKNKEYNSLQNYYNKTHTPLVNKWHKHDFFVSCLLMIFMWIFIICVFCYAIVLKNKGLITSGDVAITLSLTYLFIDFLWASLNQTKDFFKSVSRFSSAISILQLPQNSFDKSDCVQLKI